MELKYKIFPYPVLWNVHDDFKTTSFNSDIKVEKTIKTIRISVDFIIDNCELEKYINEKNAEYLVHVECPLTAYRKVFSSSDKRIEIEINESELNSKVSICTFIVAKRNIDDYRNYDFNDDYAGVSFKVKRGSILAIADQLHVRIDKNTDELANLPSIISIVKKETNERFGIQVDMTSDKIQIHLNSKDYSDYMLISKMHGLSQTMHSSLILPALIYVFEQLKCNMEEYESYRWFRSIGLVLKKHNMILNEELLRDKTSLELAQKLLDMPTERTFTALLALNNLEEEDI